MSFDANFKAAFSLANKRIGVTELLVSIVGGFVGIFLVYNASHMLLGQTGAAWMWPQWVHLRYCYSAPPMRHLLNRGLCLQGTLFPRSLA